MDKDYCIHCDNTGIVRVSVAAGIYSIADCWCGREPEPDEKEPEEDHEPDDRYWSGTGESMDDESYTDYLNGPGPGWCG